MVKVGEVMVDSRRCDVDEKGSVKGSVKEGEEVGRE